MEDTAGATCSSSSSSSPPPELTVPSPSQRGQKRGAPDEDEAAGDGAARGSSRRAGVDAVAEDDCAPLDRQLLEFSRVHPGAANGGAAAGASAAGREPVDVMLRLGVGPVVDTTLRLGLGVGPVVDTTLRLGLGSAAAPGEDDGRHFQSHGNPATIAALGAAASNAEPDFDEGLLLDSMAAALFQEQALEDEEGFFLDNDFAKPYFAATAGDGSVGSAAGDDAAGRPSSGLDLNKPAPPT